MATSHPKDDRRIIVTPDEMLDLFKQHRDAERRRDFDAIIDTFTDDCYLATVALGTRTLGHDATRVTYAAYFAAFPDLAPDDQGFAVGEDPVVTWGHLSGTSEGQWLGLPPGGGKFDIPFTNVATFANGKMQ